MTFPNAKNGVSKLFTSEVLCIVATILILISYIFIAVAGTSGSLGAAVGMGVGTAILATAGFIILIVAYILQLVGLGQAAKDDSGVKTAFYCAIAVLIINFVAGFFKSSNPTIASLLQIVTSVLSLLVFIYTILGISRMAEKLNDADVADDGASLIKLMVAIIVLQLVCNILAIILVSFAAIISIVVAVLQIVQYILFINFLRKAKNMLAAK